jgi:hypothetical protein
MYKIFNVETASRRVQAHRGLQNRYQELNSVMKTKKDREDKELIALGDEVSKKKSKSNQERNEDNSNYSL